MLEKLKRDNFWFGFIMGLIIPVVIFSIAYVIDDYFSKMKEVSTIVQDSTKYIIGVFFNLILFRIYMVNWRMDRTGRGLLAITFVFAIGYIVLFHVMGKKFILL